MSRFALNTEGILLCQSMCGVKKKGQAMTSTLKPFTSIAWCRLHMKEIGGGG